MNVALTINYGLPLYEALIVRGFSIPDTPICLVPNLFQKYLESKQTIGLLRVIYNTLVTVIFRMESHQLAAEWSWQATK